MTTLKLEDGSGCDTRTGMRFMYVAVERGGEAVSHDYVEETPCGWDYDQDEQPRGWNQDDNLGHVLAGMSGCGVSALMETLWNGKEARV